jgi:pSer/pThr/pTyr-binding forkhead associated (FHA) protein
MTDSREGVRRPARTPLRRRSRRRWAIAGGVAMCWVVAEIMTRSIIVATVLLVAFAGLGIAGVAGLRAMGISRDHPWLQRMASRPWRDGQDVLNAALRHLSDVFVVTPSGSLLAPNVVEIQLNPGDLIALRERMELDVICASATVVYEEQVTARGARFAGPDRADVYVIPDESVAQGRYRLRQGVPVTGDPPPGAPGGRYQPQPPAGREPAGREPARDPDVPGLADSGYTLVAHEYVYGDGHDQYGRQSDGSVTIMEQTRPAIPSLRLVTGSSVAVTTTSGARAGRGSVELVLPSEPTISRVHALFTFSAGRWWISNQGRNGLCVNNAPVTDQQPLSDGDSIRWGSRPDAIQSRVEIG